MNLKHKDFIISSAAEMPAHYRISFDGTGRLADALQGYFTSVNICKERIDAYLSGRLGKRNAKTSTESGV